MQLIYLAPLHWSSFAQRPHMFVHWFHEQYQCPVLWVNPYPTRFPVLNDLKRIAKLPDDCATDVPDWLNIITLSALPIEPLPASVVCNAFFWRHSMAAMKNFSSKDKTLLAIGKPSALALSCLEQLPIAKSFYDVMDDYPEFYSGLSRTAFAKKEKKVVEKVDVLAVSSSHLFQKWSKVKPDVQLVRNGLMQALFAQKVGEQKKQSLVFGYVGTIAQWFDWEWVIHAAHLFPHATIKLIGPVYTSSPQNLPGNIEFYPACSHANAIEAMRGFDIGLIPFKKNALTAGVDPIKFYEYKALNIPVVSTTFGEMEIHRNYAGVFMADSPATIASAIEQALTYVGSEEEQLSFIRTHDWSQRFSLLKHCF